VLKFVLSSTSFTFNNIIYKQTFDTPMDSSLSPIIADVVMQDLEENILNRIEFGIPFYYRYVTMHSECIVTSLPTPSVQLLAPNIRAAI